MKLSCRMHRKEGIQPAKARMVCKLKFQAWLNPEQGHLFLSALTDVMPGPLLQR